MTVRLSRFYLPFVIGFLALAVVVRSIDPFFVQALRLIAFDSYQRLAPQPYDPDLPVRIVDIGEDSLARIGQWPWPRTTMRDLTLRLAEHKAAAIAFDIMFAEPDRNSLEAIARARAERLPSAQASALAAAVAEAAAAEPPNDDAFAAALKQSPSVLAITLTDRKGPASFTPKAGLAVAGDDPKPFIRAMAGISHGLPALEEAASGLGSINWVPSRDQVVRRTPLVYRLGDAIVPSLAAEALRVAQGATTYLLKSSNASGETALGSSTGLNHIKIGDIEIPTDADGALTLKFRESNPGAFIPAWKVLAGEVGEQEIAGKIVFVGTSAPGLLDLRATPLDAALPGVEVHAQVVEHILAGGHLTRPDYFLAAEEVLIVALGLLIAAVLPRLPAGIAALFGLGAIALLNVAAWSLYKYGNLLLDPFYPSLVLLVLTAAITFYIYRQVETQRGEIRGAFGRYLAPVVVEEIIANPGKLVLGGEVRELSLMFCDVRNFTSISEKLTAHELTQFINELLTPLSDIIHHHRGTIDKYMGDAIMAFWNAPLGDRDDRPHGRAERALARRGRGGRAAIQPRRHRHRHQHRSLLRR
jgi:adenylate cyclase